MMVLLSKKKISNVSDGENCLFFDDILGLLLDFPLLILNGPDFDLIKWGLKEKTDKYLFWDKLDFLQYFLI